MKFRRLLEKLKSALGGASPKEPDTSRVSRRIPESNSRKSSREAGPVRVVPPRSPASVDPKQKEDNMAPPGRRPEIDLFIGFDLGTSCSKVVIGNPEVEISFPVVFQEGKQGVTQFLLPTTFREDADGCHLVREGPGTHSNFKLRLMSPSQESGGNRDDDLVDLTVYATLVLRETLQWFYGTQNRDYSHFDIVWNLAVGFPKKEVSGRDKLALGYREAMAAASILMGGSEAVTRKAAFEALHSVRNGGGDRGVIDPELIELWPEIAAQLAGYMRSPYHRNGNLVLIDIGAGTLDVSAVILHGAVDSQKCSFHHCAAFRYA